jgi:hypothetical protein
MIWVYHVIFLLLLFILVSFGCMLAIIFERIVKIIQGLGKISRENFLCFCLGSLSTNYPVMWSLPYNIKFKDRFSQIEPGQLHSEGVILSCLCLLQGMIMCLLLGPLPHARLRISKCSHYPTKQKNKVYTFQNG